MLDNFESISSTAIVTSYPRTFTNIPYEKDIYNWIKNNYNNNPIKLDKKLAPEIEARYKLINRLIDKCNKKQIIELAAGYTSRGLIYAQKGYNYIEMDLKNVSDNKKQAISSFTQIPSNLNIISGNALDKLDYNKCKQYLNNSEIIIVNEGLLRYLTFDEKRIVAKNIYSLLKEYGGVWITCDVTPKKFIQAQNNFMPEFNNNLNVITSRNTLADRFENIEHIKKFMKTIGFSNVEIHKFIEVKDELSSFDIVGIDKNSADKILDSAIVAIMKI